MTIHPLDTMKWVTTFLKLQLAASALFSFSFASDIDELTKIASKRKSVRDLYSDSTALKDFTFYLDR